MKKTAKAPANIAFIKYWGKTEDELRLPANSSFSMNLSEAYTITTVEFSKSFTTDSIEMYAPDAFNNITLSPNCVELSEREKKRIIVHLDRVRQQAGFSEYARVATVNSFPKGAGIASSASGFAALSVAAASAAGLSLPEKEVSILARQGSGSACRSIPDGFVVWDKGTTSNSSYAHSVGPSIYWDLRDILCIVDTSMKKVSTTQGHEQAQTSPLWNTRQQMVDIRMSAILEAFKNKDFHQFGTMLEEDSDSMHTVMQTQDLPLYYWTEKTIQIMKKLRQWRADGLAVYYTIDAGPNVHVICEANTEQLVSKKLKELMGIKNIIVNKPARGAHLINDHLF